MADISKRLVCDDDCGEGERGERGKRGHRGHDGADGATGPTGPAGAVTTVGGSWGFKWSGLTSVVPTAAPQNLADDVPVGNGSIADRRYPFCSTQTTNCFAVRVEANTLASIVGPAPVAHINLLHGTSGGPAVQFATVVAPAIGTSVSVPVTETFLDGDDIEVQVSFTGVNETSTGVVDVEVVVEFQGPAGATGPQGPIGPSGGPTGPAGPVGPAGPAGSSSIQAYASGVAIDLVHTVGNTANTGALVAFGSAVDGVDLSAGTITLSPTVADMAFSLPRAGTITQLSGFYLNTVAVDILALLANVEIEVYLATGVGPGGNVFSPTGVILTFPAFTGAIAVGDNRNGTSAAALAVSNTNRLLLVARVNVTGTPDALTTLTGYISAGLAIA